ncbi:MAG: NADH-quinone oxidoreductase subunit NuoE [Clostridiales bacterium]|nr:NADH-quinone oxidoreductase subunit NuoE [Clostridiales bacterium]
MAENKCCCNNKIDKEKMEKLEEIINEHKTQDGALIPVLHEAQELFGYLPEEVQQKIADGLGVSLAEVYGVATFYSRFTLTPKGKYNIQLCLGTACYVKGADKILLKLEELLGIKVGETTPDGKFSIEGARCLGACGLAPVMVINGEVYGKVTPDMIKGILDKYE